MSKLKWLVLMMCSLLVIGLLIPAGLLQWYEFTFVVPQESRELLSSTDQPEELKEKVGGLGLVMELDDGGWFAICYRDTHSGGIWSHALTRLSDGSWYESDFHFCGAFGALSHLHAQLDALQIEVEGVAERQRSEMQADLIDHIRSLDTGDLASVSSLDEAKVALISMGFVEL
ncbi:MAG: hypothetical protein ACPGN3_17560 [Opitutales bacterium]